MKNVTCNEGCGKEFTIIRMGSVIIRDDIERVGFDCPHCKKSYTVHYLNNHIKKLQEEQRKLLSLTASKSERQLKGILSKIKSKKQEISKAMNELKKEVEMS